MGTGEKLLMDVAGVPSPQDILAACREPMTKAFKEVSAEVSESSVAESRPEDWHLGLIIHEGGGWADLGPGT